jgi:hypothetical protein
MAWELVDLKVDLIFACRRMQPSRGRGRHRRSRSCSYRWPTRALRIRCQPRAPGTQPHRRQQLGW